jgi:hypothetical protein
MTTPRITPSIGEMAMDPTPHIKTPNPPLNPKVHIHKMIVEAFFRFENLHEGCEDQNQLDNQLKMENPTNDLDFSVGHKGHQEALLE